MVIGVGQANAAPAANPSSAPVPSVAADTRMTLLITVAIVRPDFSGHGGVSDTTALNRNIAPTGPKFSNALTHSYRTAPQAEFVTVTYWPVARPLLGHRW